MRDIFEWESHKSNKVKNTKKYKHKISKILFRIKTTETQREG